jgi:hypothetical protein
MTTEEYRKFPALNFSLAKHLLKSPAHFKAAIDDEREETTAMIVGTLVHAMVLEGKNLLDLYAIKPAGMSFATKEGKAWKAEQTKPILAEDAALSIPRMAESIANDPHAAAILKGCQHKELPIIGSLYGVQCKALLDNAGTDGVEWVIADLKKCQDASPRGFKKQVANFDLDLQMAWYSTLLAAIHGLENPPHWYWIAIEDKPPYLNMIYSGIEWMDSGMRKLERVIDSYKECTKSGEWPLPYRGINILEKPAWA